MPDGKARLDADRYREGRLDPYQWILKEKRLIGISQEPETAAETPSEP